MKRFVLDASVALAWFLDDPVPAHATLARRSLLAGDRAVVPTLWQLEIANGFVVAERRGILNAADVGRSLDHVEQLLRHSIESTSDFTSLRDALTTARTFHLSAYDAVYLDTAREMGLPLATLDQALRTAAVRAGVEILH